MGDAVDPQSEINRRALIVVASTLLAVTNLTVGLRVYVRAFMKRQFHVEDWLMLIAQGIFITACGFTIAGVKTGLGGHNSELEQHDEINALKWQVLATSAYIIDMGFIKVSIALFLIRLNYVHRRYQWILGISAAIVAIWSIATFFWYLLQCNPVEAQWDYTISGAKCVTSEQVVNAAYALSVMTILSDWLYALIPIPMVWGIKMTKQAKLTVIIVLGLGIFVSIATLIRLKFLAGINDTADLLFTANDALIWTLMEPGVAIAAASLITIRPLLQVLRVKGFSNNEDCYRVQTASQRSGPPGAKGTPYRPGELTMIDMETGGRDLMLTTIINPRGDRPQSRHPEKESEATVETTVSFQLSNKTTSPHHDLG